MRLRMLKFGALAAVLAGGMTSLAAAQSLQERLDDDRYLRGLRDLHLPEIIEHYLQTHPASDEVQAALQTIARHHAALAGARDSARRREIVDAILAARAALIARHPGEPRRAVWLADQAADLYFEALPLDATGLTAIFGLPDAEQRRMASELVRHMHEAADEAERTIDGAIRALESAPDFARSVAMQQERRHLAEVERDRRIPFFRGISAFLQAELNVGDAAGRAAEYELAARTLGPLQEVLDGSLLVAARLHEGLALARLGRADDARSRFAAIAQNSAATPADVFAARIGGVFGVKAARGPQAALEALDSVEPRYLEPDGLFFRVLIADQRFLLRRELALAAAPADRSRLLAAAFAAYTALLKAEYPPGAVPRDTLRSIVFARLVTAADTPDLPSVGLPAIVTVARADFMSRDESTREQAILALEGLLSSDAASGEDRAAALFVLGRALYEHDQRLMAAQRFAELAREHASDPQAERAIELAATLADEEHRAAPADVEAADLLRQTLELLLARYPNLRTIDRWRYSAGRLSLEQDRFDDAHQHFSHVTHDAAQWLDAQFMLAATARQRAVDAGPGAPSSSAGELHQQTLVAAAAARTEIEAALASATDPSRRQGLEYYLGMLRVFAAEARLSIGEAQQAIDSLAGIERDASLGAEIIGEAMKVRINAYQALRPPKPEEALADLQRFVQSSPAQAGAVLQPMLMSLRGDVQALLESGREQQAREAANRTLLPAARTLQAWLDSPSAPSGEQSALLRRLVADAHRLAGACDAALAIYDELLRDRPQAAELLLGRAECLFELGGEQRLADAMNVYKRLGAAGAAAGHEAYWLSQLRMLEILDRTGRSTGQIAARIERLRQGDPNFGGERYRRGFESLRAKYR